MKGTFGVLVHISIQFSKIYKFLEKLLIVDVSVLSC